MSEALATRLYPLLCFIERELQHPLSALLQIPQQQVLHR